MVFTLCRSKYWMLHIIHFDINNVLCCSCRFILKLIPFELVSDRILVMVYGIGRKYRYRYRYQSRSFFYRNRNLFLFFFKNQCTYPLRKGCCSNIEVKFSCQNVYCGRRGVFCGGCFVAFWTYEKITPTIRVIAGPLLS